MMNLIHMMTVNHPYCMCVVSFLLAVATDIIWTKCVSCVQQGKAGCAANWSFFLYLFGVVYTQIIVENNATQVAAYLVGAWIGTYIAVKKEHGHVTEPV